ncbi:MAG: hypothetical protein L0Y58_03140 [Verrucomicrobia subdivision 3 bacterium]|nr:hypothetical protein [Limisphaerales bacterium]
MTTLLLNSFLTAGLTTIFSCVIGFAVAAAVMGLPTFPKRICLGLALTALAFPPFVVANCWLHYLGHTGVWRSWLALDLFSIGGVVCLLTLMYWPVPFLGIISGWQRLDSAQLECEPLMRGWAMARFILWPGARDSLGAAATLTFALALNQFAIPAILQVKVLPLEVWIRFNTELNAAHSLSVAWPLALIPLALLILLRRKPFSWPSAHGPVTPELFRRRLGRVPFLIASGATFLALGLSVGSPAFQLLSSSRMWSELPQVTRAAWPIALNSFVYAATAAALATAIAFALWRKRVMYLSWLLFLLPGMLLAILLILLLNRPGLDVIYRSATVIIAAFVLRYCGPAWALVRHAFQGADPAVLDAAKLDNLSGGALFRFIYWPLIAPAAAAAWYVIYLLCLWDVETIALIYPPGAETLALRVFNLLHYGHAAQVNALCFILLALAAFPAALYFVISGLHRGARDVGHLPTNPQPVQ